MLTIKNMIMERNAKVIPKRFTFSGFILEVIMHTNGLLGSLMVKL